MKGKLCSWFDRHVDEIAEVITTAAVIGFGFICFGLGKYDC